MSDIISRIFGSYKSTLHGVLILLAAVTTAMAQFATVNDKLTWLGLAGAAGLALFNALKRDDTA